MPKVGRIMLLLAALFAVSGATQTFAATQTPIAGQASTCSSSLVSTASCVTDGVNICIKPSPVVPQVEAAVITVNPENNESQTPTTTPTTPLPAGPQLSDAQMASDGATLDSDKIFDLINQYRTSQGLAPFEKEDSVCQLAQVRSTEIPAEIKNGTLHSGLYNRDLPYWIWENAKYGSNEEGTVAWWLASPIHHKSIVGDYKYSCVKCTGSYCSELFTSFVAK